MAASSGSTRVVSAIAVQRACDECRTRKTRCDRAAPCSHCRAAGIACRTTTQRSTEHKDRVNVTKQYENKIDRIESRLANIERLLQESCTSGLSPSTLQSCTSSHTSITHLECTAGLGHLEDDPRVLTPDYSVTGLRADSMAAKNVFEHAVGGDLATQQDGQLKHSLEVLRGAVNNAHLDADEPSKRLAPTSTADCRSEDKLPDWERVRPVLERFEKKEPLPFNWLSSAVTKDFCRLCRSMYEHGQDASPLEQMLVYSIMSNICTEFSCIDQGRTAESNHRLARRFFYLLLGVLDAFPMLTPPSLYAAEALVTAASTTIGMCKPSLSWTLTYTAARMCQALGFHRLSRTNPSSDPLYKRKVMVFWSIFIMDRNTSLRLGRAPVLQDYDIDTPMLAADDEFPSEMVAMIDFWVQCARFQGRICTQLYGPAASTLSHDDRARLAQELADGLKQLHQHKNWVTLHVQPSADQQINPGAEVLMQGEHIMIYSTLATALQAIPVNHPRRYQALEAARQCLQLNRDISSKCLDNVYAWTVYCHWVLLHTPLTPFTGMFCNIVAHPQDSKDDLRLLEDFVASLGPACRLSEGVERFHGLCSVFVQVAQAYVRIKSGGHSEQSKEQRQAPDPDMSAFDEHLSALGFFGAQTTTNGWEVPLTDDAAANGLADFDLDRYGKTSLLDWYSGNVSLYNLLEQDLDGLNEIGPGYVDGGASGGPSSIART